MMANEHRLADLWRGLGATSDPEPVYLQIAELHGDAVRCCHDLGHVASCLRVLDRVSSLAEEPGLVEAALWFHDAVFDPIADDNEARSAEPTVDVLGEAGLASGSLHRVAEPRSRPRRGKENSEGEAEEEGGGLRFVVICVVFAYTILLTPILGEATGWYPSFRSRSSDIGLLGFGVFVGLLSAIPAPVRPWQNPCGPGWCSFRSSSGCSWRSTARRGSTCSWPTWIGWVSRRSAPSSPLTPGTWSV